MSNIPFVIDNDGRNQNSYDIYSRLLKDRIIFITGDIDDELANSVVAQLLYLEKEDSSRSIDLYINSPGGDVTAGLAIYDTMKYVQSPVSTICIGQACSMASVLLAGGEQGKRFILPNSTVMIHQPWGEMEGQVTDMEIAMEEMKKIKERLNSILSDNCSQEPETVAIHCERDYHMSAEEALDFGIVDNIVISKKLANSEAI